MGESTQEALSQDETTSTEETTNETVVDTERTALESEAAAVRNYRSMLGTNLQINKNGDLYVRHPTMQGWSFKNQQCYTVGANIDVEVVRAIVNNPLLVKEIKAFLNLIPSKAGFDATDKANFVKQFQKPKKEKKS